MNRRGATIGDDAASINHHQWSRPMNTKSHEESAVEILIAAINAKVIVPPNPTVQTKAEALMYAYAIILDGLRDPHPIERPKRSVK
jgi:hypothetical protein